MPQPNVPSPDLPPELARHPKYLILRELGRGGMGVVYQARHKQMDRQVVIKVINRALLEQPDTLERFRREVRSAAQLSHPNIVTAYDAEQAGELHMLVMEFVPGQSLAEVLEKKGPLPVAHACHYMRQAALGLQHAHKRNMVHRDIKPSNLMLTPQGKVKILDFGLAKIIRESGTRTGITPSEIYIGTPEFSAPEQASDMRTADIRADLYSLGCTLYCLLAARPPFCEDTALKILVAHQQKAPQPLTELRPEVPERLWRVIARLLAKEPTRRYQEPKDVVLALTPFVKPGAKPDAKVGSALPPGLGSPGKGMRIEAKKQPTLAPDWRSAPPPARRTPTPPSSVPTNSQAETPRVGQAKMSDLEYSVPFGSDETMVGKKVQDEGWFEEQDAPRPTMPPGTKAAIFLLSFMAVVMVLAGALWLIREAAVREVAISPPTQRSPETPPRDKKKRGGDSRENEPPPPPPAEQPQPDKDPGAPEPPPPRDNEDKPGGKKEGGPKVPPPQKDGKEKPENRKDNAVNTHPPSKQMPVPDYEATCKAARAKLLERFDTEIAALRKGNEPVNERLKWIDILKKERERFEKSELIPWSKPMRRHVDPYLVSLMPASVKLHIAYLSRINKELQAGHDAEVDRLRSERKNRLKVMARWRRFVSGRPPVVHTLYSNGNIDDIEGENKWNYENGVLIFRWAAPEAPEVYSVDQLFISPDGMRYEGTNLDKPEKKPNLIGVYVLDAPPPPKK